jgi:hypothetical protein
LAVVIIEVFMANPAPQRGHAAAALAGVEHLRPAHLPATPWQDYAVFTAPGLNGSTPTHWQSAWERRHPEFRRIEQAHWARPDLDEWARRVVETLLLAARPALVVAHSFGCLATLRAAAFQSSLIAGALLVAPADPDRVDAEGALPAAGLEFPLLVVASDNDPWMPWTRASAWAERWGGELITLPNAGHINVASGHSDWPEGLQLLERLCRRVDRPLPGAQPRAVP